MGFGGLGLGMYSRAEALAWSEAVVKPSSFEGLGSRCSAGEGKGCRGRVIFVIRFSSLAWNSP